MCTCLSYFAGSVRISTLQNIYNNYYNEQINQAYSIVPACTTLFHIACKTSYIHDQTQIFIDMRETSLTQTKSDLHIIIQVVGTCSSTFYCYDKGCSQYTCSLVTYMTCDKAFIVYRLVTFLKLLPMMVVIVLNQFYQKC